MVEAAMPPFADTCPECAGNVIWSGDAKICAACGLVIETEPAMTCDANCHFHHGKEFGAVQDHVPISSPSIPAMPMHFKLVSWADTKRVRLFARVLGILAAIGLDDDTTLANRVVQAMIAHPGRKGQPWRNTLHALIFLCINEHRYMTIQQYRKKIAASGIDFMGNARSGSSLFKSITAVKSWLKGHVQAPATWQARARSLTAAGWTQKRIAAEVGMAEYTIRDFLAANGITKPLLAERMTAEEKQARAAKAREYSHDYYHQRQKQRKKHDKVNKMEAETKPVELKEKTHQSSSKCLKCGQWIPNRAKQKHLKSCTGTVLATNPVVTKAELPAPVQEMLPAKATTPVPEPDPVMLRDVDATAFGEAYDAAMKWAAGRAIVEFSFVLDVDGTQRVVMRKKAE